MSREFVYRSCEQNGDDGRIFTCLESFQFKYQVEGGGGGGEGQTEKVGSDRKESISQVLAAGYNYENNAIWSH